MLDLEAIELIKQLKARYFRFLDTADIPGLHSVFSEDVHAHFKSSEYDFEMNGWPELETFYQALLHRGKVWHAQRSSSGNLR